MPIAMVPFGSVVPFGSGVNGSRGKFIDPCAGRLPHWSPATGLWKARFDSDWIGYREDLDDFPVFDTEAIDKPLDDQPASTLISIAPYSLNIYTLSEI